jgi:lipopolysaccharide transport system permease protein
MKAPAIQLDEARLTVRVRLELTNSTGETWTPEAGYAVGYQVHDPDTGVLVMEGRRRPIERTVPPGESLDAEIEVELPPAPGRYRVFVSSMQENVCWHYERGARFLAIDAEVGDGARITGSALLKLATLRRRRALRSVGRAFTLPVELLWRNRGLIRSMVRRDIYSRYRGSFAGLFWTVLNPLLLMATYAFVFGVVLQTRFGGDPSRSGFVLYFLCGMLPWLAFGEAAGRAPFVVLEQRNLVKKLVFPLEILPANISVAALVTEVFALGVFVVGLFAARGGVPASALWLPALLIPQLLFTMGVCWFLAALGVYLRDLGQIIGFLLTLWFFLTPICYPVESLPAWSLGALSYNPIFTLVAGYREIFLERHAPSWGPLGWFWLLSIAMAVLGHAWFYKLKRSFADVI